MNHGISPTEPGIDGPANISVNSSVTGVTSNTNVDSQSSGSGIVASTGNIHNSANDETLFTKPPVRDGMTAQVFYFLLLQHITVFALVQDIYKSGIIF